MNDNLTLILWLTFGSLGGPIILMMLWAFGGAAIKKALEYGSERFWW